MDTGKVTFQPPFRPWTADFSAETAPFQRTHHALEFRSWFFCIFHIYLPRTSHDYDLWSALLELDKKTNQSEFTSHHPSQGKSCLTCRHWPRGRSQLEGWGRRTSLRRCRLIRRFRRYFVRRRFLAPTRRLFIIEIAIQLGLVTKHSRNYRSKLLS
jgi:hypothetical protein